jgi:IclR family transcriptional regulator, acetate operon repressor
MNRRLAGAEARPFLISSKIVRLEDAVGGGPTLKPFAFIEAIAESQRPLSVSEMSALLNVPQPTAHRIVHMLELEGLLAREPGTRKYGPGARLNRLGFGVISLSARAAPRRAVLEGLSKQIGETCNFGIRVGNHLMYLDRVEAEWPFGLRFEPGSRVPLHCTAMGKLLLSFMSRAQRQRLLRLSALHPYTQSTITEAAALERECERIRELEVATDNQEFLAGVVCAAVPVRTPNRGVTAGLAISAPVARVSLERLIEYVPMLHEAAVQMGATFDEVTETGRTRENR